MNSALSPETWPKLFLRLGTDAFHFMVQRTPDERLPRRERYAIDETLSMTANLKQFVKEQQWNTQSFQCVEVVIATDRFTLMPLEHFEDEQAEKFYSYNLSPRENEEIHYNILSTSNVVVLFGFDRSATHWLNEQIGPIHLQAEASLLIEQFALLQRGHSTQALYAHLSEQAMGLYAFSGGNIQLANVQRCNSAADRLYFLLYLWKQLLFDVEHSPLYLCGEKPCIDPLLGQLRKYIRHVSTMDDGDSLDFNYLISCE